MLGLKCYGQINYPVIWEQDANSGLSQGAKQFSYYQMTVSQMYYTGVENLAIKVSSDSFDSDPDLFISRVSVLSDLNIH